MALKKDREGCVEGEQIARHQYRWGNPEHTANIVAAAAVEHTLLLDAILAELRVLNATLRCPNFLGIPKDLRAIAVDARRRNRLVKERAAAKRKATREQTKAAQAAARSQS